MQKAHQFPHSVTRIRFGNPFPTGAVTAPEGPEIPVPPLPEMEVERTADKTILRAPLQDDEYVFGLGQMLGSLNRRGKKFRIFARDDGLHTPDKPGIYGNHPILYLEGRKLALLIDTPAEVLIDVGFDQTDTLVIEVAGFDFDLYFWDAPTATRASQILLSLIGNPVIPPRWAFGYQQCRYSYPDEATVRGIAAKLRELNLPSDAIYIDIDYMKDYKVFTFDPERFPDPAGLVADLKKDGFRLIPIIDPGIRVEAGFEPYESGIAEGIYCSDAAGVPFTGGVWPGLTHFPDFFQEKTRRWWAREHRKFIDMGFKHFWNDMNEPAIFYTPESLEKVRSIAAEIPEDLDLRTGPIEFISRLGGFFGSEEYYSEFFHHPEGGEPVPHRRIHNLYGDRMSYATHCALDCYFPEERHFVLTRSSYLGTHRHAVLWTGDNHSWWEHLLTHMRMLQSLSFAGFFFCGADVGGFSGNASESLLIRWTQLGVFSPLFRNHSGKGTRDQEPWMFSERGLELIRNSLELRSALVSYLYSEYLRAVEESTPFIEPAHHRIPNPITRCTDDQFFVGSSIMPCPVYTQNADGRFVHLPGEGKWLLWKPVKWNDLHCRVIGAGSHYVPVEIEESCAALPENALLPLHAPRQHDGEPFPEELLVFGLITGAANFLLRGDDGLRKDSPRWTLSLTAGSSVQASAAGEGCPFKRVRFVLFGADETRREETIPVAYPPGKNGGSAFPV